jgi:hypothetical protein
MTIFRVHFEDHSFIDAEADHPDEARSIAAAKIKAERGHAVRIAKVKIVKEKVDA